MMEPSADMLPICRVNQIEIQPPEQLWLIESIWAHSAVGIIGGAPKCCKSWFGLDMALSIASATHCLGRFAVKHPGPVLIFLAGALLLSLASIASRSLMPGVILPVGLVTALVGVPLFIALITARGQRGQW